jgi:hypothetical protein
MRDLTESPLRGRLRPRTKTHRHYHALVALCRSPPHALETELRTGGHRQHDLVTGKLIYTCRRGVVAMKTAGTVAIGQPQCKPFTEGISRAQEQAVIRIIGKRAVRIIGVLVYIVITSFSGD